MPTTLAETMTPVAFNGCFGWLHAPAGNTGSATAVLICQSLMKEAMVAHCSLRLLGDELAKAGYAALRFDYPGTGDSCDSDFDAAGGQWKAWQDSIVQAATWLRAATGASHIVLCGMRLGATLAALAAHRVEGLAGLVLLEPAVNGNSYVRQLRLEAELLFGKMPEAGEGFEVNEFRLGADTLAEIAEVDLHRLALPEGLKVALLSPSDSRTLLNAERPPWQGLDPLLRNAFIDESPLADVSGVVDWLRGAVPPGSSGQPIKAAPAELHPPGCLETPLRFGLDGRLFGLLTRPSQRAATEIVLIGNCGRDPHYGPARQSVTFARRLATSGAACLRLDYAGLGDSLGPTGTERIRAHVFRVDRVADIKAAIDALEPLGFQRFAVQGVCSGAYHALHGALSEPRITTLLLVNIPLFTLPTGDVQGQLEQRYLPPLMYLRKLFERDAWAKLLSGRGDLGKALRTQFAHVPLVLWRRGIGVLRRLGVLPTRTVAWRMMATLSRRGVRTLFVLSPNDKENEHFNQEFGPTGERLGAFAGTEATVVLGMDHGLMKQTERAEAEKRMIAFIHASPTPGSRAG